MIPLALVNPKTCSCGREYKELPLNFIPSEDGVWWHCPNCRSTLFAPWNKVLDS